LHKYGCPATSTDLDAEKTLSLNADRSQMTMTDDEMENNSIKCHGIEPREVLGSSLALVAESRVLEGGSV
jgi:hypothetical protein